MQILLTGGSGDLGRVLSPQLESQSDTPIRMDIRPPQDSCGIFVQGSILDRDLLAKTLEGVEAIVHIAAWHGIHEFRKQKDAYDFWDLNVTGTFNVFEAAARAGINKLVYISSTSVEEKHTIYGHTKILGEEIARAYSTRHNMNVITLRPRAFIPHWNGDAYSNFVEWAHWFWGGAVHISDVKQAVLKSLHLLNKTRLVECLPLVVDGAYEYTDEDLSRWDEAGPGSTFRRYYPRYHDLALRHGLNPAQKPEKKDISETRRWLGYEPAYSLRNLLDELEQYGEAGPPLP